MEPRLGARQTGTRKHTRSMAQRIKQLEHKSLSHRHTHTHALSEPVNGCISNGSPTNPLNSSVCYRLGESCDEQSTSEVRTSWPPTKRKDTGSLCSSSWCCFRNSRLATSQLWWQGHGPEVGNGNPKHHGERMALTHCNHRVDSREMQSNQTQSQTRTQTQT